MTVKTCLVALLAVVLALVATTVVALEQDGVLLVETQSAEGEPRVTHIWFVEDQGILLLEAGNPEKSEQA